ncbi:MAG: SDR family oxidoreductase [Kutzneria sp.]|nr:SDR family oxidoreductase [Kutzneria sp.]MBV9847291.1 SDR family oxidoreductase [Kutzneria sp.]
MSERVVIVGGTSGIGLATAQRLVDGGREVVVTGRRQERLTAALTQLGERAAGELVDATDAAATAAFFGRVGPVDHVVITVTASGGVGAFRDIALDSLRQAVDGKLLAHVATAQAALPTLRGDGSLTFVTAASSGAALPGTAGLAAVNASIEAMVPVLAVELAPLRVNAVAPGVIDTPWWDWLGPDAREATFAEFATAVPVGRVGHADEIAGAIHALVDNGYLDGVVLRVDGGARLRPAS